MFSAFTSQSKPTYSLEDDDPPSKTGSTDKVSPVSLDEDLNWAVEGVAEKVVSQLRLEMEKEDNIDKFVTEKLGDEETSKAYLRSVFLRTKSRILRRRELPTNSELPEEESKAIHQLIESKTKNILDFMRKEITEAGKADKKLANDPQAPRQQRNLVNNILTLIKRNASLYEIFGVKQDATKEEIIKKYREMILHLHPDKNKDPDAQECTQAVITAREILSDDEKRKSYDKKLQRLPPPPKNLDSFGESFASNAYDDDTDDDYDDEDHSDHGEDYSDYGDDMDIDYGQPSKEVTRLHRNLSPLIRAFFQRFRGAIDQDNVEKTLAKVNEKIVAANKEQKMPNIDAFQVPYKVLLGFRFEQQNIALSRSIGLTNDQRVRESIVGLQRYLWKTHRRGIYQWPDQWIGYVINPLRKRLIFLGVPQEIAEAKTEAQPEAITEAKPGAKTEAKPGAKTEANPTENSSTKRGPRNTGATQEETGTLIAHSSSLRHGTRGFGSNGVKYFYEVNGSNKLRVRMAEDVNSEDVVEYQRSERVYNIKEKEVTYHLHKPTDLIEIQGVAFLPQTGNNERVCWTYVRAKIRGISDHVPIMTRSALRDWQGKKRADKQIDDFLVKSNTIPPWAMDDEDPMKHEAYLRLEYPLPKKNAPKNASKNDRAISSRRVIDNGYYNDSDDDILGLRRSQQHYQQNRAIEDLTNKMDKFFNAFMEESRQNREQNREILQKLLTSGSS